MRGIMDNVLSSSTCIPKSFKMYEAKFLDLKG